MKYKILTLQQHACLILFSPVYNVFSKGTDYLLCFVQVYNRVRECVESRFEKESKTRDSLRDLKNQSNYLFSDKDHTFFFDRFNYLIWHRIKAFKNVLKQCC
jgi:hypothetical protein